MQRLALVVVFFVATAGTALAQASLVRVEATGSVAEAADRLAAVVEEAGARVVARIAHSAGAAMVDMELADAELVVFGNPRIGTPVMQEDIRAGLVLPLKVLVYNDAGQTVFLYEDPAAMLSGYDVPADLGAVGTMTGALGNFTAMAAD